MKEHFLYLEHGLLTIHSMVSKHKDLLEPVVKIDYSFFHLHLRDQTCKGSTSRSYQTLSACTDTLHCDRCNRLRWVASKPEIKNRQILHKTN